MSRRLVPVHNPHPGGTYIWFTVTDDPEPDPWDEPPVTESGERVASAYRANGPEPEPEAEI